MFAAILVSAAVTFALRWLPLRAAHSLREREDLREVSAMLPVGIMLILVAYTFVQAESAVELTRLALAAVCSLALRLITSNFLLCLLAGFAAYSLSGLLW